MHIVDFKDLEQQGVSAKQFEQSLQIECFSKVFQRSIDLHKRFKTKVFNVSQELTRKGIDNIITENNYSYTIWKEISKIQKKEDNHLVFEKALKTLSANLKPHLEEANFQPKPSFIS
jgi:hypothetical protein